MGGVLARSHSPFAPSRPGETAETLGAKDAKELEWRRTRTESGIPKEVLPKTQRRHRAAQWEWLSAPKPGWLTEDAYVMKIQPWLTSVTISAISSTLGVSESYAADIRACRHRLHPRHWQALAAVGWLSMRVIAIYQQSVANRRNCCHIPALLDRY